MAQIKQDFDLYKTMIRADNIIDEHNVNLMIPDYRGRPVGALVSTREITVIPPPFGIPIFNDIKALQNIGLPPGKYYKVVVQKTKGGQVFGPLQESVYFTDNGEATVYIQMRLGRIIHATRDTHHKMMLKAMGRSREVPPMHEIGKNHTMVPNHPG